MQRIVLNDFSPSPQRKPRLERISCSGHNMSLGLYKILVYFEAVVHESTILSFPPPTCIAHPGAMLLHNHWTVYDPPSDLPFVCCAIHHNILVITISCRGQDVPVSYPCRRRCCRRTRRRSTRWCWPTGRCTWCSNFLVLELQLQSS